MTHYLVTGASGVVGSAIVPPLLAYPEVTLQVLMRPKKPHPRPEYEAKPISKSQPGFWHIRV